MCSGVATLVANMQPTFTRAYGSAFGVIHGEDLVGVAQPRFDKTSLRRFAAQLRHGAHQTEPVQQLLVAAGFDVGQRGLTPGVVVGLLERAEIALVCLNVRMEVRTPGAEK